MFSQKICGYESVPLWCQFVRKSSIQKTAKGKAKITHPYLRIHNSIYIDFPWLRASKLQCNRLPEEATIEARAKTPKQ